MVILEEIQKEMDYTLVTTVCVVEIFTTEGINFSAKSAKDSGAFLHLQKMKN